MEFHILRSQDALSDHCSADAFVHALNEIAHLNGPLNFDEIALDRQRDLLDEQKSGPLDPSTQWVDKTQNELSIFHTTLTLSFCTVHVLFSNGSPSICFGCATDNASLAKTGMEKIEKPSFVAIFCTCQMSF